MLDKYVPTFEDSVFEGYNAKLPEDANAYKAIDTELKRMGFAKRAMPTSVPQDRRFMYWKDDKYVMVTAYYAGGEIYVEIPTRKTEAKLAQNTVADFVKDYIEPYTHDK